MGGGYDRSFCNVSAVSDSQNIYGAGAAEYAEHARTGEIYVQYERPAIRALAGDVRGRRVLDIGCGPGDHIEWLLNQGASRVAGVDGSPEMIEICRRRFPSIEIRRVDLAETLSFAVDHAFDLVMSSLAIHYVQDWSVLLTEAHRVLRPSGRMVISTHHPFSPAILHLITDYYETVLVSDRFQIGSRLMDVQYYHRPLAAVLMPFREAGFRITQLSEPPYRGNPTFLFIEAQRS